MRGGNEREGECSGTKEETPKTQDNNSMKEIKGGIKYGNEE